MAGDDHRRREALKMASWIKPKMAHKSMVQRLLQVRAHLILCFRAEEKIEIVRQDGKTQIVPKGWMPICEKNLPYELTASFLLTPDAPGMPKPLKLQEQHRPFFPLNEPITEESGRRLAEWARGGNAGADVHPSSAVHVGAEATARSAAPDVSAERQRLLQQVAGEADLRRVPRARRDVLWKIHCGDATRENVDPSALADLLAAVKAEIAA